MLSFIAEKDGKLSKQILKFCDGLSYSAVMKLLRSKDVKVNGSRVKDDLTLSTGDRVEIYYTPKSEQAYSTIFSDNNVLVVFKKSGYTSEKIFELVKFEYVNAGFIHRLDRNTQGVMVFSLNSTSEKELLLGFKNRTFKKLYLAEIIGFPEKSSAVLEGYLKKDSEKAIVRIYDKKVDGAVYIKTAYKTIKKYENSSLVEVELFTGKTHQIRAHLAHIGHPVVGDGKYGDNAYNKAYKVKSQRLTAYSLTLYFEDTSALFYLNGKTFTCPTF